jgi:hypothetical protein
MYFIKCIIYYEEPYLMRSISIIFDHHIFRMKLHFTSFSKVNAIFYVTELCF